MNYTSINSGSDVTHSPQFSTASLFGRPENMDSVVASGSPDSVMASTLALLSWCFVVVEFHPLSTSNFIVMPHSETRPPAP